MRCKCYSLISYIVNNSDRTQRKSEEAPQYYSSKKMISN